MVQNKRQKDGQQKCLNGLNKYLFVNLFSQTFNMHKKTILFLTLLSLISCAEIDEGVSLEILNDKLFSFDSSFYNSNQEAIINDTLYVKKSLNVVHYKLINHSNKPLAFYFEQFDYFVTDEIDTILSKKIDGFGLSLLQDDTVIEGQLIDYKSFPIYKWDDIVTSKIVPHLGILDLYDVLNSFRLANSTDNHFINVKKQYFVLFPNQSKHFVTSVNLPLRMPYDFGWLSKVDLNKKYDARLSLRISKPNLKNLPKYLQDEIIENKFELFYGEIRSNRVPLVVLNSDELLRK